MVSSDIVVIWPSATLPVMPCILNSRTSWDTTANTLMSYLPRDRSDEIATKGDIARLEARFDRLDERMDRLEERMGSFSETMITQQRFYSRSMVGAMVALTAIFSLVVTFFG